jgi:diguanylate cyclase (GGDEF)-like protein
MAVAYLGLVRYSFFLNDPRNAGASLWPAAGLSLAALLVLPTRRWGWVLAGVAGAELGGDTLIHGYPLVASLFYTAGNTLQPLVAATLIRRFGGGTRITPVANLTWFVAFGVVVAPMVGATLGALGVASSASATPWTSVWWRWLVGDGLGVLSVAPVLLAPLQRRGRARGPGEAVVLAVLVVTCTAMVFRNWSDEWDVILPSLIIPLLILAGLRFGIRAAALTGFVVAQGANLATAIGYGPFALAPGGQGTITLLQVFLGIALITGFVVAALVEDVAGRHEVERLLTHQAEHDALTGLPNRLRLMHELGAALAASATTGRRVGVFFLDLDRFKVINDSLGHRVGDLVLTELAQRLARACRPHDTIARFGGDEFVVVCPDLDGAEQAADIAERLLATASQPVEHAGHRMSVGVSVGVVLADGTEVPAADLLRDGDTAMYRAKAGGGGRFEIFDRDLRRRAVDRWEMEVDLAAAIDRGQLRLVHEPIVSLRHGRTVAMEALLRWHHPERGVLPSSAFLAVAEETGLIRPIGQWVAETAIAQLGTWPEDDLGLSFNASALQLAHRSGGPRLVDVVADACRRHGVAPGRVWLELNESALLVDPCSVDQLAQLDALGLGLVLDHFGSGYSSLARLRTLPFGVLKIDEAFVGELAGPRPDTAVLRSIIELGHALGMVVVAQGVHDERQAETLAGLGCDLAQGGHFSPPGRFDDVARART